MQTSSIFSVGSLVSLRGREWVCQPNPNPATLLLRPLGGTDSEIIEVSTTFENVAAAEFQPPDPSQAGDARACALLRDAVRLGLRSTTGPYRCFGKIAVEPRPYQLVPLMMAMKQDTIRLLIADDVGIGKTVEALLIGRELMERGEIQRMAVLCPPPLAEQWQAEMAEKFGLEAELVLPTTARRLEKDLQPGESLFEKYPITVISLDFIKSDSRREDFLRCCPEFVIVDEAHICASSTGRQGKQQRNSLVAKLCEDNSRHMLFVTATPHSGKDDAFRSLLTFLNPEFAEFSQEDKSKLAQYFVQRRRGDIESSEHSPFPGRKAIELTWTADGDWKKLFDSTLKFCRDNIRKAAGTNSERLHWWASLILLRAISSSPAAAITALKNRAEFMEDASQFEAIASQSVYDSDPTDEIGISDGLPGANASPDANQVRSLLALAKNLLGKKDGKLMQLVVEINRLLNEGYSPVIFCRFIATANYLADQLKPLLANTDVQAITSVLSPSEREQAVDMLGESERRVLIATDCLSEGINLQSKFNAVIHYDLSWNPGRHEQREGRVDRFGQPASEIRVITWWGKDNPMDGMILDVLLRKHVAIRQSLGISVPVPSGTEQVLETIFKSLLLRNRPLQKDEMLLLPHLDDWLQTEKKRINIEWDKIEAAEAKRSRTLFRQSAIKPEQAFEAAIEAQAGPGNSLTVANFVRSAWQLLGGHVSSNKTGTTEIFRVNFDEIAARKHQGLMLPDPKTRFCFDLPCGNATYLHRTHPLVENLASYLAQTTLEDSGKPLLPRCGVMRTNKVDKRITLLLCRFRFQISQDKTQALAEECLPIAFQGNARISEKKIAELLAAEPDGNCSGQEMTEWLEKARNDADGKYDEQIKAFQKERAEILLASHRKGRKGRWNVKSQGKPDILGIYVYLPNGELA